MDNHGMNKIIGWAGGLTDIAHHTV